MTLGLGEGVTARQPLAEGVVVGTEGCDNNAVSVVGLKPSTSTSSMLPNRQPNFATLVLFPAKY